MLGALTFLLAGSLLQGVLCGDWSVIIPQTVTAMKGSCVTIPCSFEILDTFKNDLITTCTATWYTKNSNLKLNKIKTMTGDLTKKDCTSTFNGMSAEYNDQYFFRLDCPNTLKYNYNQNLVHLRVTDDPPAPELTPSALEVKEGSSVSVTCSASAPCLTHPPTLTWSPSLGDVQEQLQENEDKTQVKKSVLTFTASHLHHGKTISCTVFYKKQDGSQDASVSRSLTAAVSYSPKDTTVSVSPSGPVQHNSNVTLTCRSNGNPAVRNYAWYRADGSQETVIGTEAILNIKASEASRPFFCKATNDVGVGRSKLIDIQFPPQILPSSDCTKTAGRVNCSCETVGNPSPTLHWYLDGLPVNQSDKFVISNERLHNDKGLRSFIIMNQPQEMDRSILICRSFNSLGSASQQFCLKNEASAESHDRGLLFVFITTTAILFMLVCILLFGIRALKNRHNCDIHLIGKNSQVATSQNLMRGTNEVPNTTEEDIYANTKELRQPDVADIQTMSELNDTTVPTSGPNNAEGVSKSSEKNEESDVIYSTVSWKSRNKKGADYANMNCSGDSYLEEEKWIEGGVSRNFMSNALEMGNLYDEVEPRNVRKETECEYAQVQFKSRNAKKK